MVRPEQGYIALLAVLIVSAVVVAISLVLLTTGTDRQRAGLAEQQSKQARSLAVACTEEALQQIHDNIAYANTGNLSLGQGTCSYAVTVTAPATRSVTVTGTVGNLIRKIQVYVTIGPSSISITSWQEIN